MAELRCHTALGEDDPTLYLHVTLPSGRVQDIELQPNSWNKEILARPQELLWASDSKAFFINGSENAYSGFFVDVYRISDNRVQKVKITNSAQRDMVKSFPPCAAVNRDEQECKEIEANPNFNMSGLSWVSGSSAVIVMAEVPCSSSYGGIMCQVLGYKLDIPNGKILQRMTARELKHNWQKSMGWQLRIPDPPVYGPPFKR